MGVYAKNEVNVSKAEKIVKAVKDYGEVITSKEIFELFKNDFSSISAAKTFLSTFVIPEYPNIKSIPRKGYVWDPIDTKKEEKSTFKNSEGYSDPTAGKAIANCMTYQNTEGEESNQLPGEVWFLDPGTYKGNKKFLALVIAGSKGCINYIPVRDFVLDKGYFFAGYCVPFTAINGREYFVDIRQLRTSGQNAFDRYSFLLDFDKFKSIKQKIAERFKIETVEVVKEVPVYETKEVPAAITEESAIKFLQNSGWIEKHDEELTNEDHLMSMIQGARAQVYEQVFKLIFERGA